VEEILNDVNHFGTPIGDPDELMAGLQHPHSMTPAEARGWILGALAMDLAYGNDEDEAAILADVELCALADEVFLELGAATWWVNSDHPLRRFRHDDDGWGWSEITTATFDLVVLARSDEHDMVLVRTGED
jgi:hypothetical protein